MKINNYVRFLVFFICFSLLSISCYINAFAEDNTDISTSETKYTVSYGKGIYISYAGSEPKNFIKGDPPLSSEVEENGNVIVADNTFTFRDYSFGGWRYTYTDENGKKKNLYFNEGDIIENINCDMKLEATWTKKKEQLKVGAFVLYASTNEKSEHYVGEIISLPKAPKAPADNYTFCGWTDNEGTVLYSPEDNYQINNINTVIKPIWSVNGERINYRKISVTTNEGGKSSVSQIFILSGTSQLISFTPNENYMLTSVKVNGVSKGAAAVLSVTAENEDIYIEAEFKEIYIPPVSEDSSENSTEESDTENEFTITVLIAGKGTVSPSESFIVEKGENVTLTFTPDKYYRLPFEITDNGESHFFNAQWNGTYTIESVDETHEIQIQFISQSSVLAPSLEESTASTDSSESNSNFTQHFSVLIFALAVVFGLISVAFVSKEAKSKKQKRKKKKTK